MVPSVKCVKLPDALDRISGVMALTGVADELIGFTVDEAVADVAGDGGISYFCNWRIKASAVGTDPHETSRVFVLARTSCTREGAGGFSTSKNQRSLKHT